MRGAERSLEYYFGQFQLNSTKPELWKGTEKIQLTRKRHEILLFLVRSEGRILGKEELLDAIWPEKSVEESNLSNQIHYLRRIIEDEPANPKIIVTIPGLGYQFQGTVSLSTDLTDLNEAGASAAPERSGADSPIRLSKRKFQLLSYATALLLLLLVAGALRFHQKENSPPSQPLVSIPATYYQGMESYPALSPNGKLLAFTWDGNDLRNSDIYVKQVGDGEPIRLTSHPNEETRATWSPDGTSIAFLRRADPISEPFHLIIVPALGGMEREVARVDGGLDWSPDGRYLAVINPARPGEGKRTNGIHLISVDGKETLALSQPEGKLPYYDSFPRFSPDGELLAFVRWKSDANGDIYTVNLRNGEIKQLTFDQAAIGRASLQWINNGQELMFISNRKGIFQLWKTSLDGEPPVPILNSNWPIDYYSVSRESDVLVYVPRLIDSLIEVSLNPVNSRGRREVAPCVINSTQMEEGPRLSPDGSSLVFISNRTGWDEVWTARSDCTQSRQLTSFNTTYVLGSARWSPDGKEIAFDRRIDGRPEIFIIKNDGTGLRRLTNSLGSTRPCWSPDGAWIYFTLFTPGPPDLDQIWRMPVTGGEMTRITVNGGVEPSISPDGKRVYYSNYHHLYQKDLPSGAETPVPGLENIQIDRYWEISNSAIFYVPVLSSQLNDKSGIYRFDLGTRTSTLFKRLDKLPIPGMLGVSITLDERLFAIGLVNQPLGDIMMIKGWR